MSTTYVLITAVQNEELYIEKTIRAVVSQTVKPKKWAIVNDGSTDGTEEIARHYSLEYDFIHLLNKKGDNIRDFASKVLAIHLGLKSLQGMHYDFIGNIDGDIEFDPGYFECLLKKFYENEKLGIAGGWVYEIHKGKYKERFGNSEHNVPGSIQMFRRECLEVIGNYLPIKTGGEDFIAEVMARMHGWSTKSFPDLRVFHLRPTGTENAKILGANYRLGKEDYFVGNHPLFELLKCLKRIRGRPFVIGSFFRLLGYVDGLLSKEPITVPQYVFEYLRKEQIHRIKSLIKIENARII
jgi:glycosyltransferase involved in cell wall biosynthesis